MNGAVYLSSALYVYVHLFLLVLAARAALSFNLCQTPLLNTELKLHVPRKYTCNLETTNDFNT